MFLVTCWTNIQKPSWLFTSQTMVVIVGRIIGIGYRQRLSSRSGAYYGRDTRLLHIQEVRLERKRQFLHLYTATLRDDITYRSRLFAFAVILKLNRYWSLTQVGFMWRSPSPQKSIDLAQFKLLPKGGRFYDYMQTYELRFSYQKMLWNSRRMRVHEVWKGLSYRQWGIFFTNKIINLYATCSVWNCHGVQELLAELRPKYIFFSFFRASKRCFEKISVNR